MHTSLLNFREEIPISFAIIIVQLAGLIYKELRDD